VKGKEYFYKVKSKRVGDKVRQEIVQYFGRVDKLKEAIKK